MGRVVILGAGVMGSAMAMPISSAGHRLDLVGTHLDVSIIQSVQGNGYHPRLNLTLPSVVRAHHWTAFKDIQPDQADLIVIGVSSAGIDWVTDRLAETLTRPVPIVMITKGLRADKNTIADFPTIVSEALKQRLGFTVPVMAIGGPCIAGELAALRDTLTVITGPDTTLIQHVIDLMSAPYYHARASQDVIGVEVCAAFKNFFALGVGWAQGHLETSQASANSAKMHNLAAGLFTQSLNELAILTTGLGGQIASVQGLAGAGDLYVTCLAGRNSRMGRLLGLGLSYNDAKSNHMPNDTVEGAELAIAIGPQLESMWADGRLPKNRMPLSVAIVKAICHNETLEIPWATFMQ